MRALLCLLLVVFVAGCDDPATLEEVRRSTTIPTLPAPTPRPTDAPITHQGQGEKQTATFRLQGGAYRVDWEATIARPEQASSGCFHAATLHTPDTLRAGEAGTGWANAAPARDSTYIYNLRPGMYYLSVNSGCIWSITLTQVTPRE